jgi:hypothetical protein
LRVVVGVHGIAQDPTERATFAGRWERLLAAAGIQARIVGATWDSSGSITIDIARIASQPRWLSAQVDSIAQHIALADLVIAHSFGAPLVVEAMRRSSIALPLFAIGSPLGHPIHGFVLGLLGMTAKPGRRQAAFDVFNVDDPVTTSPLLGRFDTSRDGWVPVRVALPGNGGFGEHSDVGYVSHPTFLRLLRGFL